MIASREVDWSCQSCRMLADVFDDVHFAAFTSWGPSFLHLAILFSRACGVIRAGLPLG
jgi:hypothetical protein